MDSGDIFRVGVPEAATECSRWQLRCAPGRVRVTSVMRPISDGSRIGSNTGLGVAAVGEGEGRHHECTR